MAFDGLALSALDVDDELVAESDDELDDSAVLVELEVDESPLSAEVDFVEPPRLSVL